MPLPVASSTTSVPTTGVSSTTTSSTVPPVSDELPPDSPPGAYSHPETTTVGSNGALVGNSDGRAAATVSVPPGALPVGTQVSISPATAPGNVAAKLPNGQSYIASFAVAWVAPDGTTPSATQPITMTIDDPAIRAGDTVYILTPHGLKAVGTAVVNGMARVTFTTDPDFVVAAVPKLARVSGTAKLTAGAAEVEMRCDLGARCAGTALLRAKINRHRTAVLARGRFTIGSGKQRLVKLALTSEGRRLLASRKHQMTVQLVVRIKGGKIRSYRVVLP